MKYVEKVVRSGTLAAPAHKGQKWMGPGPIASASLCMVIKLDEGIISTTLTTPLPWPNML